MLFLGALIAGGLLYWAVSLLIRSITEEPPANVATVQRVVSVVLFVLAAALMIYLR